MLSHVKACEPKSSPQLCLPVWRRLSSCGRHSLGIFQHQCWILASVGAPMRCDICLSVVCRWFVRFSGRACCRYLVFWWRWCNKFSVFCVWSKEPVVSGQVNARSWHQRRQSLHELDWWEHQVCGAVVWRSLEFVHNLTLAIEPESLFGYSKNKMFAIKPPLMVMPPFIMPNLELKIALIQLRKINLI